MPIQSYVIYGHLCTAVVELSSHDTDCVYGVQNLKYLLCGLVQNKLANP